MPQHDGDVSWAPATPAITRDAAIARRTTSHAVLAVDVFMLVDLSSSPGMATGQGQEIPTFARFTHSCGMTFHRGARSCGMTGAPASGNRQTVVESLQTGMCASATYSDSP